MEFPSPINTKGGGGGKSTPKLVLPLNGPFLRLKSLPTEVT